MDADTIFEVWNPRYEKATKYMSECSQRSDIILVEVAAQHPLVDGLYPGIEFKSRLMEAGNILYNPEVLAGCYESDRDNIYVYVPGSKHEMNGVEDKVSLSTAGITWLDERLPQYNSQFIGGDKKNFELTDGKGIFNSEDECLAATRVFEELEAGRFISVCSQGQMMRKALYYIQFGYYPEFIVVPGIHHNPIWEAVYGIPRMLTKGASMTEKERSGRITI